MELSTTPLGLPSLPGLRRRRRLNPTSPLFPLHLSSRPIPNKPLLASPFPKSDPGWCRSVGRPLRARASEEESSTAVASNDASNRAQGPSFWMSLSSAEDDTPSDDPMSKLNLKMDLEKTYTILFLGAGSLVTLWISATIISAIDSLPVFPKVMEVVGFGVIVWFCSRYLIFKDNREELFTKLDDLKKKILGPGDD